MATDTDPTIYAFDNFRINAGRRLFFNGGEGPIPLPSKVFDTLLYLVTHNGLVIEKDELIAAIWPDTIVEENNLNKNISALRQLLGEKPAEHRFIVTVPGRGYKFVADVRRIDNETIPQTLAPEAGTERRPSRKSAIAVAGLIAAIAIAALALSYTYFFSRRSINSIAVMPFANKTGDPKLEYLSDELAGDLIESLEKVPGLEVKALSTVVRYKEATAQRIGQELNVEAVLLGSVIESGELQVELVDSRNGNNLWRRTYPKKESGLVVQQSELAGELVRKLSVPITEKIQEKVAKRDTENSDAKELYLRGGHLARKITEQDIRKAIEFFSQAIQKDPSYAKAYAAMASARRSLTLCCDGQPSELLQAKLDAQKAVTLDDELAEGHSALAAVIWMYDWKWAEAEREFQRALELGPNSAIVHFGYGDFLGRMGRSEEAVAQKDRAAELEPYEPFFAARVGGSVSRDPEKALKQILRAIDLDPNYWFSHLMAASVYSQRKEYDRAIEHARLANKLSPDQTWSDANLSSIFVNAGRPEEARAILDQLLLRSKSRFVPPYHIAMVYNNLGDKERALYWLEKAYDIRDAKMVFLKTMPWKSVKDDPRFKDILRRVGFVGAK